MHDATVDTTDGTGATSAAAGTARADAGAWFGPQFAGEGVPLLAEVLDAFGASLLNIEIKGRAMRVMHRTRSPRWSMQGCRRR